MNHEKLVKLTMSAVMTALVFVATYLIQIPMPATGGYVNLGDCMVLLSGFLLGPSWGFAAGGLGSMLTDVILGSGSFAPGTFFIKGLMALAAALIFKALRNKTKLAALLGGIAAELIMVFGYFAYEALVLGFGVAAAASIPGNAIQALVGLAAGVLVYHALSAVPAIKKLGY